jgi:ABC-type Fe3+-siderophore transport system permease subunit
MTGALVVWAAVLVVVYVVAWRRTHAALVWKLISANLAVSALNVAVFAAIMAVRAVHVVHRYRHG